MTLPERETGASRLLDSVIRERLFGTWREVSAEDFRLCSVPPDCTHVCETATGNRIAERYAARPDLRFAAPEYSSDIAAAFLVVEAMRNRPLYFELRESGMIRSNRSAVDRETQWAARFVSTLRPCDFSRADTPALAICLAALKALDAESPDKAQSGNSQPAPHRTPTE